MNMSKLVHENHRNPQTKHQTQTRHQKQKNEPQILSFEFRVIGMKGTHNIHNNTAFTSDCSHAKS
jgi:hypothetical protein